MPRLLKSAHELLDARHDFARICILHDGGYLACKVPPIPGVAGLHARVMDGRSNGQEYLEWREVT